MDKNCKSESHSHEEHEDKYHSVYEEFACHLPYAVFSVAFSLIILSIMTFISIGKEASIINKIWNQLFHNFHFVHIVFASVGTLITFFRFSQNIIKGLIVGFFSSSIFCVLSDVVMPYIGGELLGVKMDLHVCFIYELHNILPFLFVGLFTGLIMKKHYFEAKNFSLWSHFTHIFISSLASSFYLVSHGFYNWANQIGFVFLVLVIAVVIPCTLSDVVIPILFAKSGKKYEKK